MTDTLDQARIDALVDRFSNKKPSEDGHVGGLPPQVSPRLNDDTVLKKLGNSQNAEIREDFEELWSGVGRGVVGLAGGAKATKEENLVRAKRTAPCACSSATTPKTRSRSTGFSGSPVFTATASGEAAPTTERAL